MKKLISKHWALIVVVAFGLVPIIWFWGRGDVLISGVDINFPLNPISWFARRFYAWNSSTNAGGDFSSSTAGLFFHFLQVFPYILGFSLTYVQLVSLLFWSLAIALSAYLFSSTIFPKHPLLRVLFVAIYSFNTYLFNTWENIKVANLSLVAAIPLTLFIFIQLSHKRMKSETALLFSFMLGVLVSGAGINPAYLISFFVIVSIFILPFVFFTRSKKVFFGNIATIFVPIVIANLFWIIPTIYYIFSAISGDHSLVDIGFTDWIDSLSENTSIVNVLRLQGAWDWYSVDAVTGNPLFIPYAVNFFHRLPFIAFSFMLPILAFCSLVIRSKDKVDRPLYLSFAAMIVVGVFMGAGTHEPTGAFFKFLNLHVPFFSLFRSPWYIFTPLLTLAYAGLISLMFKSLYSWIGSKKTLIKFAIHLSVLTIIIGNFFYTYPQITGKIFRPTRPDRFYVYFPEYIYNAGQWLENVDGRVIGYPDDELEQFSWGYRGIESILNLVSNVETIYSPFNVGSEGLNSIVKEFYLSLKKGELEKSLILSSKLNISHIFEKTDQPSLAPSITDKMQAFEKNVFDKWVFYKIPKENYVEKIAVVDRLFLSYPDDKQVKTISVLNKTEHLVNAQDSMVQAPEIKAGLGALVSAENSQEQEYAYYLSHSTYLTGRFMRKDVSSVTYTFETPKDGDYQMILEAFRIADFGLYPQGQIEIVLDDKVTTVFIDRTDGTYIYFVPRAFTKGKHTIKLALFPKNLVGDTVLEKEDFVKDGNGEFQILRDSQGAYLNIRNTSGRGISANTEVHNFSPYMAYLIEFSYQQVYGDYAEVLATQGNVKSAFRSVVQKLPNHPNWKNYYFYYDPVRTDSQLFIQLVGRSVNDAFGTEVNYRDLEVYPVFTNSLVLKEMPTQVTLPSPEIEITRTSPVRYTGRVSNVTGPNYLVFSENYSKDWILEVEKIGKLSDKHFKANMYANAWYVPSLEDYSFTIYYRPQSLLIIGWALTVVGFSSILVYYFLRRRRRNE